MMDLKGSDMPWSQNRLIVTATYGISARMGNMPGAQGMGHSWKEDISPVERS
jgi:hypothetical protein